MARTVSARVPAVRVALAGAWLAASCCALAAGAALAQQEPPAAGSRYRLAPATPGNLTREEKRCHAGMRRVERQNEAIAETARALAANQRASETCSGKRACDQVFHRRKALEVRLDRQQRQQEQLGADAAQLCATTALSPPR